MDNYLIKEKIKAKSRRFKKDDIGKYVIVQDPCYDKDLINWLFLVDRKKTKQTWWTHDAGLAIVFQKKNAAQLQARKYKYNNVKVVKIKESMIDDF